MLIFVHSDGGHVWYTFLLSLFIAFVNDFLFLKNEMQWKNQYTITTKITNMPINLWGLFKENWRGVGET